MRRLILMWGCAVALSSACGQASDAPGGHPGNQPADPPSTTAQDSSLEVEQESAGGLAGTFRHEHSMVAFSATTAGDGATSAQIKLDDRAMTASRNRSTGQATWSGGGAVLTPQDQAVLRALAAAIQDRWGPAGGQSGSASGSPRPTGGLPPGPADQHDLLLRLAMLLAEAPLGVPLGEY